MRNYCARSSSIPRSLRHVSPHSALEDAACLAMFLRNVVGDMFAQDGNGLPSDESNMGLALCFDLLLDKIAIAGGELSFPLAGLPHERDLPPLWDPEREGGDHE